MNYMMPQSNVYSPNNVYTPHNTFSPYTGNNNAYSPKSTYSPYTRSDSSYMNYNMPYNHQMYAPNTNTHSSYRGGDYTNNNYPYNHQLFAPNTNTNKHGGNWDYSDRSYNYADNTNKNWQRFGDTSNYDSHNSVRGGDAWSQSNTQGNGNNFGGPIVGVFMLLAFGIGALCKNKIKIKKSNFLELISLQNQNINGQVQSPPPPTTPTPTPAKITLDLTGKTGNPTTFTYGGSTTAGVGN